MKSGAEPCRIAATPGVEPNLGPREERERERGVGQAEHRRAARRRRGTASPPRGRASTSATGTRTIAARLKRQPDERQRLELSNRDLDEHERRAPDGGEREQHDVWRRDMVSSWFQRSVQLQRVRSKRERACRPRIRRRAPPIQWRPELGRRAAASPGPRSHRLGVRAYPGVARAGAERLRARGLLAALVRALRLQALGAAPAQAAVGRASACCRARARTPA